MAVCTCPNHAPCAQNDIHNLEPDAMTIPDAAPVFLLGSQRSGTTLLRLMLNKHPNIAIPYETGFMTAFMRDTSFLTPAWNRLQKYPDLHDANQREALVNDIMTFPFVRSGDLEMDKDAVLRQDIGTYPELIDAIMTQYATKHGKRRWGDKTPEYTEDIDLIWELFPGCKFVHLVRDGRDVALRQLKVNVSHWFSKSMPVLADRWARKTTICHKVGNVLGPAHYLELKFEDLIGDPEAVLRQICEFLDEPYAQEMLDYAESSKKAVPQHVLTAHTHSYSELDPKMVRTWEHEMSRADQVIFDQIAGHALQLFGYERRHRDATMGSRLKNLYYATLVRY